MARFILFAGDQYYPLGGARDVAGGWNSLEEAIAAGRACGREWWNILDASTGEFYYDASEEEREDDEQLSPEEKAKEAAEQERIAMAEQARQVLFGEKFDEVTDDPRQALTRRCKLRGHQPVREQKPKRKGAKAYVACACGTRLYERTEDGYARVLDPTETIATVGKKGKRQ